MKLLTIITLPLALICTQAHAWTAVAYSTDTGFISIRYNAPTPEEAQQNALADCSKKAARCVLVGSTVHGMATVIARGPGAMFRTSNPDPQLAAKTALSSCTAEHKTACWLDLAVWDEGGSWFALAMGNDDFYAFQSDSRTTATTKALEMCGKSISEKGSCAIFGEFPRNDHLFFSWAASDRNTGWGYSTTSKEDAIKTALEFCNERENGDAPCVTKQVIENKGPSAPPAGMKKVLAQVETEKKKREQQAAKQAPNEPAANTVREVNHVTCKTNCSNGNCVSTFPDGNKIHWQARLVPDPFDIGRMKWDTSGCGVN